MLIVILRSLILYGTVVFAYRLMGKKQVGEMQPGELVLAIMVSDLASVPMQDMSFPLIAGIAPILALMAIEILIAFFTLKSNIVRKFFVGSPSVIINKGVINIKEMKNLRYNIDDLFEQLRVEGIKCVSQVEYAILETNGEISIIKKDSDNLPDEFSKNIIKDGKIDYESLNSLNKNEKWLMREVKKTGAKSYKDIFLFSANSKGKSFYQLK